MLPIRTILHPTDFSEHSKYAFGLACALARDYNARLVLLHAWEVPTALYGEVGPLLPELEDPPANLMEQLVKMQPIDSELVVERRLEKGPVTQQILRVARETQSDLIVMGTHGRRGFGRLLMGSVAEEVLRKAPCPVLTVKMPAPTTAAAARKESELVHT